MPRNSDKMNETDSHHLNPYSSSGTEHPDNLINLNRWEHEAYHKLFGNLWIIDAIKKLLSRWDSAISDGKAKSEIYNALDYLDYKDSCKGWSRKKRR